jgi:hypothetical protein
MVLAMAEKISDMMSSIFKMMVAFLFVVQILQIIGYPFIYPNLEDKRLYVYTQ